MSGHAYDDRDMPGYFLPEDSKFRLARLSDHIKFLSRLAQPRIADEEKEWAPEVRMGELAFCLELLADQVDLVLDEVSWPALRTGSEDAPERDVADEVPEVESDKYAFGITTDQFDTLDRLIQAISAQGDVVAASSTAEFADGTLPLIGHAIFDAVEMVRGLLDRIEAQPLGNGAPRRSGVGEERAVYAMVRIESSHSVPMH